MFQLPFYYIGLALFTFAWLVGAVWFLDLIASKVVPRIRSVGFVLNLHDVRKAIVWQVSVILLAIVLFKWVVLSGGPGIAVDRILSGSQGSNWIAYPAAIGVLLFVAIGFVRIWWTLLRKAFGKNNETN